MNSLKRLTLELVKKVVIFEIKKDRFYFGRLNL